MPSFIERVEDPQIPPPYVMPGIEIRSFELEADLGKMGLLCDKLLNIGSLVERGFEYRPLPLPYVALEVLTYPHMSSGLPPYSKAGYLRQQEVYIRFPVVKYVLILGQILWPVGISSFFPFVFVDNAWSAISGREVIGLPKLIGTIAQATAADQSYAASLELPVMTMFTPGTEETVEEVVSIQTGKPLAPSSGGSLLGWPWLLNVAEGFFGPASTLLLQILALLDPGAFSTAQLKQFRDAEMPTEACFQGVLQSDFTVSEVSPPTPFESATVTLTDFASLPMAEELGLPAGLPINAAMAYSTGFDMIMTNTRNLFVQQGTGTAGPAQVPGNIPGVTSWLELLEDVGAFWCR